MKVEFIKDYEIGVDLIDDEHRQFFAYINAAMAAIDDPDEAVGLATARSLLRKLEDYADTHFAHEEEHMKSIGDAQLFVQIHEHQGFRDRLAALRGKGGELTKRDLGDIFIFMAKWLRGHILTSDMLIGQERTTGKFVMTKEFLTGVDLIDEEHAALFEIIGRVHDTIGNEMIHDRFDAILAILGELKEYTIKHFSDEEAYMERIGYAGLNAQRAAHEAFVDRIGGISAIDIPEDDEEQGRYLNGLVEFLNEWLINHILRMDKKIPVMEVQS